MTVSAADRLGLSRKTLYDKLKKYQLLTGRKQAAMGEYPPLFLYVDARCLFGAITPRSAAHNKDGVHDRADW